MTALESGLIIGAIAYAAGIVSAGIGKVTKTSCRLTHEGLDRLLQAKFNDRVESGRVDSQILHQINERLDRIEDRINLIVDGK